MKSRIYPFLWHILPCLLATVLLMVMTFTPNASANKAKQYYEKSQQLMKRKDFENAQSLLEKSAKLGYAEAQNDLGTLYQVGLMVPKDYKLAMRWYQKAAKKGHVYATMNIGLLYYKGLGRKQNLKKAKQWFLKAAKKGDADAQYNIGVMYQRGESFKQNTKSAYVWFALAAINGSKRGLDARNVIAIGMTKADIEKGDALAKKLYKKYKALKK
ncbi:MAG: sel1 repeat family protein [Shewanellaceae bacterium]|nr:sel1 repeat family protein [Shewanellaceae bacterium]